MKGRVGASRWAGKQASRAGVRGNKASSRPREGATNLLTRESGSLRGVGRFQGG